MPDRATVPRAETVFPTELTTRCVLLLVLGILVVLDLATGARRNLGRVDWTYTGPGFGAGIIAKGSLLIGDGKILAVGPEIAAPADAVIVASGGCGLIYGRSTMSMVCTGSAASRLAWSSA